MKTICEVLPTTSAETEQPKTGKKPDPFEELLTYTKKPTQYFFIGKKDK